MDAFRAVRQGSPLLFIRWIAFDGLKFTPTWRGQAKRLHPVDALGGVGGGSPQVFG
jgi:hypothetical protein